MRSVLIQQNHYLLILVIACIVNFFRTKECFVQTNHSAGLRKEMEEKNRKPFQMDKQTAAVTVHIWVSHFWSLLW